MKFAKIFICLYMIFVLNSTYICATQINNQDLISISEENNIETEELNEQKLKLKEESLDLIEDIRNSITSIDEKVETLRKTDEYITYPTIRLNIDTPILGLKSIINHKLIITNEVSPKDVAKGYSIRNIIKNKIVKLPNTKIGNIVITTKDVNLEDELEITDYNVIILKLMNYKDKVETVEKFLDNQINKIFKEYISKDKKENINDINERLEKISTELLKQDENLEKIFLIESIKYSGLENEYIEISNLQKKLSKNSNNILMDSKTLNELQKETISLESSMIDYLSKIEDINKEIGNEIKIENIYLKIYSELDIKLKEIEKYIESSKKEEKVKEEISDNTENIQSEEVKIDDNQVETEKIEEKENIETAEIITLYEVFSDKSIENMKNIISDLEKRMDELNIVYKQEKNAVIDENNKEKEEKIENVETKDKEEKEIKEKYKDLTNEELEKEVKEIIKKYNEFLKYEYTFYLDNINSLLKVTNEKIKNISSVTETDILSEVKYVYIDLPVNLDKYLDTYNVDSKIEIKYLISNLKDELNVLRNNYLNLQKIYDELKVNDLLNNA